MSILLKPGLNVGYLFLNKKRFYHGREHVKGKGVEKGA